MTDALRRAREDTSDALTRIAQVIVHLDHAVENDDLGHSDVLVTEALKAARAAQSATVGALTELEHELESA